MSYYCDSQFEAIVMLRRKLIYNCEFAFIDNILNTINLLIWVMNNSYYWWKWISLNCEKRNKDNYWIVNCFDRSDQSHSNRSILLMEAEFKNIQHFVIQNQFVIFNFMVIFYFLVHGIRQCVYSIIHEIHLIFCKKISEMFNFVKNWIGVNVPLKCGVVHGILIMSMLSMLV